MICIKANDLPHQSIKLARSSGEERKRYRQNVIVCDARSHAEHHELRRSESSQGKFTPRLKRCVNAVMFSNSPTRTKLQAVWLKGDPQPESSNTFTYHMNPASITVEDVSCRLCRKLIVCGGLWCLISVPEDAYSGICVWIIKAVFFLFVNGFGLTLQISTSFTQHYFPELLVYESATSKAERQKYVEKHLLSSTICLKSGRINMMMHKYQQLQQEEHKAAYICYHCTDSHYSILMITLVHGIYLFSLNIN